MHHWCTFGSDLNVDFLINCSPNSKYFGVIFALTKEFFFSAVWRNFNDFLQRIPISNLIIPSVDYIKFKITNKNNYKNNYKNNNYDNNNNYDIHNFYYDYNDNNYFNHFYVDRSELKYYIKLLIIQSKKILPIARILFCSINNNNNNNNNNININNNNNNNNNENNNLNNNNLNNDNNNNNNINNNIINLNNNNDNNYININEDNNQMNIFDILPLEIIYLILIQCGDIEFVFEMKSEKENGMRRIINFESSLINLILLNQIIGYAKDKKTIGKSSTGFEKFLRGFLFIKCDDVDIFQSVVAYYNNVNFQI